MLKKTDQWSADCSLISTLFTQHNRVHIMCTSVACLVFMHASKLSQVISRLLMCALCTMGLYLLAVVGKIRSWFLELFEEMGNKYIKAVGTHVKCCNTVSIWCAFHFFLVLKKLMKRLGMQAVQRRTQCYLIKKLLFPIADSPENSD